MFNCSCCKRPSNPLPDKRESFSKGIRLRHPGKRSGEKMFRHIIYRTSSRVIKQVTGVSKFNGKALFSDVEVTVREIAKELPVCRRCNDFLKDGADFTWLQGEMAKERAREDLDKPVIVDHRVPLTPVDNGNGKKVLVAVDPNEVLNLPEDDGKPKKKRKQKKESRPINKPLMFGSPT